MKYYSYTLKQLINRLEIIGITVELNETGVTINIIHLGKTIAIDFKTIIEYFKDSTIASELPPPTIPDDFALRYTVLKAELENYLKLRDRLYKRGLLILMNENKHIIDTIQDNTKTCTIFLN